MRFKLLPRSAGQGGESESQLTRKTAINQTETETNWIVIARIAFSFFKNRQKFSILWIENRTQKRFEFSFNPRQTMNREQIIKIIILEQESQIEGGSFRIRLDRIDDCFDSFLQLIPFVTISTPAVSRVVHIRLNACQPPAILIGRKSEIAARCGDRRSR